MSFKKKHFIIFESIPMSIVGLFHFVQLIWCLKKENSLVMYYMFPVFFVFVGVLGGEVSLHRYLIHRSFTAGRIIHVILSFFAGIFAPFLYGFIAVRHLWNNHKNTLYSTSENELYNNTKKYFSSMGKFNFGYLGGSFFLLIAPCLGWYSFTVLVNISFFVFMLIETMSMFLVNKRAAELDKSDKYLNIINYITGYTGLFENHYAYPFSPFMDFEDHEKDWVGRCVISRISTGKTLFGKPYQTIPSLEKLSSQIFSELENVEHKWITYNNLNHKDIFLGKGFDFLKDHFNDLYWDDCGYALTFPNILIPSHEDLGLNQKFNILTRQSGRVCSIFIPLKGSFKNVPIVFSTSSGKELGRLFLDQPALLVTGDGIFHKVDNRNNEERLFFCFNFYGEKKYENVLNWLKEEGYA